MRFKKILEGSGADSAKTSRNQVAAGLKKIVEFGLVSRGDINLDWGGGKYDKGTEWLKTQGIINLVYDPYNRSSEHNLNVIKELQIRKADCTTLLNVLNVIPQEEERIDTIKKVLKHVRPGGYLLIAVYAGDGSGETIKTSDGWQNNQKPDFYKQEIEENLGYAVEKKQRYLILSK